MYKAFPNVKSYEDLIVQYEEGGTTLYLLNQMKSFAKME